VARRYRSPVRFRFFRSNRLSALSLFLFAVLVVVWSCYLPPTSLLERRHVSHSVPHTKYHEPADAPIGNQEVSQRQIIPTTGEDDPFTSASGTFIPGRPPETKLQLWPDLSPSTQGQVSLVSGDPDSLESDQHLNLDLLHVPFEEAVKDEVLNGWEDQWISEARFDQKAFGPLAEPRIDFVYLWVNGSQQEFVDNMRPWELRSVLNDAEGKWLESHGTNRYRDWDELRYSFRSVEKNAGSFRNKIQVIVNSLGGTNQKKQTPSWLCPNPEQYDIEVIVQEELFDEAKRACLPTFNSLTIENQLFNVPSNVDQFFALSDDMLLGTEHSASDVFSPLFGPVMGFKTNSYSTTSAPTEADAKRFGEKPFLIYTSWLLNRRFGIRKRKGQSRE
jgi:Stealth protein CR2, conserved region 2/Stealth protein CR1, conserved region 1